MRFQRTLGGAVLALALAGAASAQQAPEVTAPQVEVPKTILFLGNSYLYYGDSIHNHVVRMARAAYPDAEFTYKSATISGAYLDQQALASHLEPGRLGIDGPFDLVVLQGHSTAASSEAKLERFNAAVREMDAMIEAAGSETALYMTPAYTELHDSYDPAMFEALDAGYTAAGNAAGALVIPVGLAFQMAYEAQPELELHKSFDGSHPTLRGTYLAAATVFAALYDTSPVGNPYTYYDAIPQEEAAMLQQIAADAVAAYRGR